MLIHSIKVIGLGGIGQRLLSDLAMCVTHRFSGATLYLYDYKDYLPHNSDRQVFPRSGPKTEIAADGLSALFPELILEERFIKITGDNVYEYIQEGDVVFVATDNAYSRRIISERCEDLHNVVVISGGNNQDYEGNVHVFIRKDGHDDTQPLAHPMNPEIFEAVEETPNAPMPGCEELAQRTPQLPATNNFVAAAMICAFQRWLAGKIMYDIIFLDSLRMEASPVFRSHPEAGSSLEE